MDNYKQIRKYYNQWTKYKLLLVPINLIFGIALFFLARAEIEHLIDKIAGVIAIFFMILSYDSMLLFFRELNFTTYYNGEHIIQKFLNKEKKIEIKDIKCVVVDGNNLYLLQEQPTNRLTGSYIQYIKLRKNCMITLGNSDDILKVLQNGNFSLIFVWPRIKMIRKRLEKYFDVDKITIDN